MHIYQLLKKFPDGNKGLKKNEKLNKKKTELTRFLFMNKNPKSLVVKINKITR